MDWILPIFGAVCCIIIGMVALYRAGDSAGRLKGYKDAQQQAVAAMDEAWKYARHLRGDDRQLSLAEAPAELLFLWAEWEGKFRVRGTGTLACVQYLAERVASAEASAATASAATEADAMREEPRNHDEPAGPRSSFQLPTSALTGMVPVSLAVFRNEHLARLAEQCILTLMQRENLPNQQQQDALVAGEHIAKVGLYLNKERG